MKKVGIPQNNTYSVDEKGRHGYQKKEVRSIVRWKEGNKRYKNRMVWTQILKDTEASKGTHTF